MHSLEIENSYINIYAFGGRFCPAWLTLHNTKLYICFWVFWVSSTHSSFIMSENKLQICFKMNLHSKLSLPIWVSSTSHFRWLKYLELRNHIPSEIPLCGDQSSFWTIVWDWTLDLVKKVESRSLRCLMSSWDMQFSNLIPKLSVTWSLREWGASCVWFFLWLTDLVSVPVSYNHTMLGTCHKNIFHVQKKLRVNFL